MRRFFAVLSVLSLLSVMPASGLEQNSPPGPGPMALQVRSEFLYAWDAYKQYAWGHDELQPLTRSSHDWYGVPLYMTAVDALDTMILMGLKDEADKTREFLDKNLSFNHDIYVSNFEITIRMLGGLISSYQMTGDQRLLDLAQELGTRLLPAFDSPTGMPYRYVNLKTSKTRGAESNPAEIGTLVIEFGTLSKLTSKPIFYNKAKHALTELYSRRSKLGLVGSRINVETGEWTDTTSHIDGGIDSYYEYLLKCRVLFGDKDCGKMWKTSVKAANKYLADSTKTGLWYAQVDMNTGKRISTHYGALQAFFPAVLVLGGDEGRAKRFEESAYKVWTMFGVEPDEIDYSTMKLIAPEYPLRPEIIESAYYLHFFTKDEDYLDMGSAFLGDLVRCCKADTGYAALKSVSSREKEDRMESYFLAETLKYLYLLFAPRDTLDLNKVVFNTEGHLIRKTWK